MTISFLYIFIFLLANNRAHCICNRCIKSWYKKLDANVNIYELYIFTISQDICILIIVFNSIPTSPIYVENMVILYVTVTLNLSSLVLGEGGVAHRYFCGLLKVRTFPKYVLGQYPDFICCMTSFGYVPHYFTQRYRSIFKGVSLYVSQ